MKNSKIHIKTELGKIIIELYPRHAPVTVANFFRYIEEDRFADAVYYRVVHMNNQPNDDVKIEVIQGGQKEDNHPKSLPFIPHESTAQTGILHKDGVVSMARNEPGTASSEFFICIGDQPELDFNGKRNADGQGFAAFGRVIEGMDVVRKIQNQPEVGQYLISAIPIQEIKLA